MPASYDVIVVGARCAGSPTASCWSTRPSSPAPPLFELTCQLASMEPPPPEMAQLLAALPGNQRAMRVFVSVIAGTVPAPEFFAPTNVQEIMAAARPAPAPEG